MTQKSEAETPKHVDNFLLPPKLKYFKNFERFLMMLEKTLHISSVNKIKYPSSRGFKSPIKNG
jgi:hypothetical protein